MKALASTRGLVGALDVKESRLSLPDLDLDDVVSSIEVYLMLNYDVSKGHPLNGVTNPKNGCAGWEKSRKFTALANCGILTSESASAISRKCCVIDRLLFHFDVKDKKGKPLDPDAQFVALVKGPENAKALLKEYYLYIMFLFALSAAARGAPARIASFGKEPRKLSDRLWETLEFVESLGSVMHPDCWFRFPRGTKRKAATAESLAEKAPLERDEHAKLDALATATVEACGEALLKPCDFFINGFDAIDPKVMAAARRRRPPSRRPSSRAPKPRRSIDRRAPRRAVADSDRFATRATDRGAAGLGGQHGAAAARARDDARRDALASRAADRGPFASRRSRFRHRPRKPGASARGASTNRAAPSRRGATTGAPASRPGRRRSAATTRATAFTPVAACER